MSKNVESSVIEVLLPVDILPEKECEVFIARERFLQCCESFKHNLGEKAYNLLSLVLGNPEVRSVRISTPRMMVIAVSGKDLEDIASEIRKCVIRNFSPKFASGVETNMQAISDGNYPYRFI